MATSTPSANGRKSLASQIDRLDGILDGLADGLNDAVAMLVKEAVTTAVKESVQAVLTELLTNPAVLAKVQANNTPEQPVQPDRPKPVILRCLSWTWKQVVSACHTLQELGKPVANFFATLNRFRLPILIAVVAGLLCGYGTHLTGSWLSVLVSSIGGVITTLAVQVLLVFRSLMLSIGEMHDIQNTTQSMPQECTRPA